MKHLLFTATLLLTSLFAFSQTTFLLDSSHHYFYANGNAENYENNYYEYDANGLKIFFHDNSGTVFGALPTDAVNEETYTYNNADLLIHLRAERFNSGVLNSVKEEFIKYNNVNKVISDTIFNVSASSVFTVYQSINYTYDSNDRLTKRLTKNQSTDEEVTYYYTGNSVFSDSSVIKLNNQGIYKTDRKFIYNYNAQNQRTSISAIYYNSAGQISSERLYEYSYDANGNNTRQVTKNKTNNVWVNYYAFNWGYTANNLVTKQVGYQFSFNAWDLKDSTVYTYDSNDNLIYRNGYKTANIVLDNHHDYYYSALATSTTSIRAENNIQITPNPYQTFMPLRITGIENERSINLQVFDLQGRIVFNNRFANGQNIVVDKELASGIYIFKVSNQEGQTLKSQQVFVY